MNRNTPICRAVQIAGGTTALARQLTEQTGRAVLHSTIHKWMRSRAPAEYVLPIESATGVSRHELRPDVFGAAPSEAA